MNQIISRTVDVSKPIAVERLKMPLFYGDKAAHTFSITVQGASLTGQNTVNAYAIRGDGYTVIFNGSISGNVVNVTLPVSVYAVAGRLQLAIKVSDTNSVMTVYACDGVILNTQTDSIVDPSRVVPSLDELLAQIAVIEQAVSDANAAVTRINNMTVRATTASSFGVQVGTNAQGGMDVNILGGVGVKGEKGDKGDTGGVASVNGVQPDGSGRITIAESNIEGVPLFMTGSTTTPTVADGETGTKAVTFDTSFPAGYRVFVLPYFTLGSARFASASVIASSPTVDGFTLRVANHSGSNIANTTNVNYFAIGFMEVVE